MKWSRDSAETSLVQWYFVPDGTPALGFPTVFSSINWSDRRPGTDPVGEQIGQARPWRNGQAPSARYHGQAPCGPADWFGQGVPLPLEGKTPQRDIQGFPACCQAVAGGLFWCGSWMGGNVPDTIVVTRSSGVPYLTDVAVLMFDVSSGFVVSQPQPNVALVALSGGGGMAIGAPVSGADPGSILYVDATGLLTQGGGGNSLIDPDGSVGAFSIPGAMYLGDRHNSVWIGLLAIWDSDTAQWIAWYTQAGRLNLFGPGVTVPDIVSTTGEFDSATFGAGAAGTPAVVVRQPAGGADDQQQWLTSGAARGLRVSAEAILVIATQSALLYPAVLTNGTVAPGGVGYFTSATLPFDPFILFYAQDGGGTVHTLQLGGVSAAPLVTADTGAGTSPTLTIAGTNASGRINLTTGTACPAGATVLSVSFDRKYSGDYGVTITPGNAAAAAQAANLWLRVLSLDTGFELHAIAALPDSTDFVWYWSARMQ